MEVIELKFINYMSDFANLFLAVYSQKVNLPDGKLYFPREYKKIIEESISMNIDEIRENYPNLLDESLEFDMDSLISCFRYSNARKYWNSEFLFDLNKNAIYTEVINKNNKAIIESYNERDVRLISDIVHNFIGISSTYEDCPIKVNEDEKIHIMKYCKSDN